MSRPTDLLDITAAAGGVAVLVGWVDGVLTLLLSAQINPALISALGVTLAADGTYRLDTPGLSVVLTPAPKGKKP